MSFERTIHHRRYCSDECAVQFTKEKNRQKAKAAYWSDPEAGKAKSRDFYENGGGREYHREYHHREAQATCTRCGAIRFRNDLTKSQKASYVCMQCKSLELRSTTCYWCELPFTLAHAQNRLNVRNFCPDCKGLLSRSGDAVGVTREYVRQQVNQLVSRSIVEGVRLTRRQAAELFLALRIEKQERKLENLRKVVLSRA